MYTFSATLTSDYSINVDTNTYWSCKVIGNFMLSKYDGEGGEIVDIIIPEDVTNANGTVIFSYGDERCKYPDLPVYLANLCYIDTEPKYRICNDEKIIFFEYEENREVFFVSVRCYNGWKVESTDLKFITNNNEIMIISSGKDGEVKIIPDNDCGGKNIVKIKLIKKR